MKNIIFLFILLILASCTKDFEEMNAHPTNPVELNLGALYNSISGYAQGVGQNQTYIRNELLYSASEVVALSRKVGVDPVTRSTDLWSGYFSNLKNIRLLEAELSAYEGDLNLSNVIAMTKILKAFYTLRTTDIHGDMPFTEAGYAFAGNQILRPKYDKQQDIYMACLNDLKDAASDIVVSPDETFMDFTGYDFYFNGDMTKWKKLANTISVRYALRMSAKDASSAAEFISAALNSGLMTSAEDEFVLKRDAYNMGKFNWAFRPAGSQGVRMGETIWPYFTTDPNAFDGSAVVDPRIHIFFAYDQNGQWNPCSQDFEALDPIDDADVFTDITSSDLEAGYYSPFNLNLLMGENTTRPIITYGEACFLQAEAYARGMGTTKNMGTAEDLYYAGIEASVNFWKTEVYEKHPTWESIEGTPAPDFTDFMTNMKTHDMIMFSGTDDKKLDKIYAQRWISLFWQPEEAFYLMKRTNGRTPHSALPLDSFNRLKYPNSEESQNGENYRQQLSQMGGSDDITTKVWWMP